MQRSLLAIPIAGLLALGLFAPPAQAQKFNGHQQGSSDGVTTTLEIDIVGGVPGQIVTVVWEKPPGTVKAIIIVPLDAGGNYQASHPVLTPSRAGDKDLLKLSSFHILIDKNKGVWKPGLLNATRAPDGSALVYCTAKVNSAGCTPAISFSGDPSATAPAPFLIEASQIVNSKNGILFYGYEAGSTPFQGGTKCVLSPTRRTPIQGSGGSLPPAVDCTGFFSFDFNAQIQGGMDAGLVPGTSVFAQYWYRDPQSPSTTGLTNAVQMIVGD